MNELAIFKTLLENLDALQREYPDPKEFLAKKGYKFPSVIRQLFDDVYSLRVQRAVAVSARGGGKTYLAAGLAASFLLFRGFHVAVVAGSLEQARYLFEYAKEIFDEPEVVSGGYIEKETKTLAKTRDGAWFKVAPASPKTIRGLHAHGRGMLLILDEEAEMDPDIVRAALKTVKDAQPSVILRISTNHKIMGTFADLVENHERYGYTYYHWDSFDVAKIDHWQGKEPNWEFYFLPYRSAYSDEEIQKMIQDLRAYWRMKPREHIDGWIRMEEIVQDFVESPREWFEVEDLGLKPSGEGLVLDPQKVDAAFHADVDYMPTAEAWIAIDWGFKGMTAVEVLQQIGDEVWLVESRSYTQVPISDLVHELESLAEIYDTREVYADASHPFENEELRNAGFDVTEVKFNQFKETGAGWLRHLLDTGKFKANTRFREAWTQLKNWRRDQSGKIVKKDDHHPDALLAGMYRLERQRGLEPVRVRGIRLRRSRWLQTVVESRT